MSANLAPINGADEFTMTPAPFASPWASGAVVPLVIFDSGVRSDPGVLDVAEDVHAGYTVPTFGDDFFDRVHYSWIRQDLGNVISQQTIALSVWNAFRRAERLNAFTPDNDEGIDVTGLPSLPTSFPALKEITITFGVGTDGPPTIDASFAFDWQTADATVYITGSRITAWSFVPDWTNGIVERMSWKTDVLQSYDMREQRRALRIAPRKTIEFEAFFTAAERRYAETLIWGWGARNWALPIWYDGQELSASLPLGSTSISIDTATRDYAAGSLAMLIGDAFNYETLEVESVSSGSITLARPTSVTWPAGTRVYPARTARMPDRATIPRWSGDASGLRVGFSLMEPVDYTASGGATTYRGYPVIDRRPNWVGGLSIDLQRKLAELDNLVGIQEFDDESGLPSSVQSVRWTLTSREELDAVRQLLYALRGRQGAGWMPTWTIDMIVTAAIDTSATAIDIEFMAYTNQINVATGRRDIRIELANGTVFHRRITGASQLSATTERLTIDTPLGQTVQPSEIAQVSFMALKRLDSDDVDIAYWTGSIAEVAVAMRSFQHDV